MDKTKLLLFISLLLVNEKITAQQGINNNWLMGYSSWGARHLGKRKLIFIMAHRLLHTIVLRWISDILMEIFPTNQVT